jgi:hypothetical protein
MDIQVGMMLYGELEMMNALFPGFAVVKYRPLIMPTCCRLQNPVEELIHTSTLKRGIFHV